MSVSTFYVKRGDTEPPYQAQLFEGDGTPLDLSGVGTTVKFTMKKRGADVAKVSLAACSIDDAVNGKISYSWQPADVDTIGTYDAELLVTLPGGREQRVPSWGYNVVIVAERLA